MIIRARLVFKELLFNAKGYTLRGQAPHSQAIRRRFAERKLVPFPARFYDFSLA
jgi:hypothetical protein